MIINEIEYDDKLILKWRRLADNLQYAVDIDWIPVPLDDEVEAELIEVGHPHWEGKRILYVKCPTCDKEYMFNQRTWIDGHRFRCN